MSLEVALKDEVSEVVSVLAALLEGEDETLLEAAAAGTAEAVRSHIEKRNDTPNKLGGKRTNYWNDVAASTFHNVSGRDFIVGVDHVGAALHYYGNPRMVHPEGKVFTIPAIPEAHDKRAPEFGDLTMFYFNGKKAIGGLKDEKDQVVFWLVPELNIPSDKTVLPSDDALVAAATAAAEDALEAITQ